MKIAIVEKEKMVTHDFMNLEFLARELMYYHEHKEWIDIVYKGVSIGHMYPNGRWCCIVAPRSSSDRINIVNDPLTKEEVGVINKFFYKDTELHHLIAPPTKFPYIKIISLDI